VIDFDLEFYKLHRAHEVALNNATAAYEQALLRLVLILNAASIGGFLALIQVKDSKLTYNLLEAHFAIVLWGLGILAAFAATCFAYWSQRQFTQAFRSRRMAIEALKAAAADSVVAGWRLYGLNDGCTEKNVNDYCTKADKLRDGAGVWQNCAMFFGLAAVIFSILGFVLAISAIKSVE
jgi:hypothetical protein